MRAYSHFIFLLWKGLPSLRLKGEDNSSHSEETGISAQEIKAALTLPVKAICYHLAIWEGNQLNSTQVAWQFIK